MKSFGNVWSDRKILSRQPFFTLSHIPLEELSRQKKEQGLGGEKAHFPHDLCTFHENGWIFIDKLMRSHAIPV